MLNTIAILQYYTIIILQYYTIIILQYYTITILYHYNIIPLQYYTITILFECQNMCDMSCGITYLDGFIKISTIHFICNYMFSNYYHVYICIFHGHKLSILSDRFINEQLTII